MLAAAFTVPPVLPLPSGAPPALVAAAAPDLRTAEIFAVAGGGARSFDIQRALAHVVGPQTAAAEVDALEQRFGGAAVDAWRRGWRVAVGEAARLAARDGVRFPPLPRSVDGAAAARRMVRLGMVDGRFRTQAMLDGLIGSRLSQQVLAAVTDELGAPAVRDFDEVTAGAMNDVARRLSVSAR